jgi:hypothetical protein
VEKYGRAGQATDDNIIRHMLFACWITTAIDTLRICNTYGFFTETMVMRTRLSVTFIVLCHVVTLSISKANVEWWDDE